LSEISDWALVFTSAGLIIATIFVYSANRKLAHHTESLVSATNELKAATNRLGQFQIAPSLSFEKPVIIGARNGTAMRFAIKNKGLGPARITALHGSVNNGPMAKFTAATPGDAVLGLGEPYYYDVENVSQKDSVYVEVEYADLAGNKYKATQALSAE